MPLNLRHKNWEPTGQTFEVLDEFDQPTGKLCWAGVVGEQQIQDDQGDWQPYIYDTDTDELKTGKDDLRCEFQSGQQVIKKAGQTVVNSLKLFVQREIAGEWVTQPHGVPTRNILHNKRFRDKELIDAEGYCIGWLTFPDAQYDLQIGIQAGRTKRATMGFRFRAPISANVRMQIVKDGLEPKTIGNFDLIKADGPHGERTVGVRFKDIIYRWTYKEAAYHSLSVEDSTTYPGKKKGIITVGPIAYTANEWVEVVPLTWGLTETSDDCLEISDTTYYDYIYYSGSSYLLRMGNAGNGYPYPTNAGMIWNNVTASGTAETGCYVKIYSWSVLGTADSNCKVYAVDDRTPPAWASGERPSQAVIHNTSIAWTEPDEDIKQYNYSPELKTVLQDRFDGDVAAAHESGDAIGIVALSQGTSRGSHYFCSESHGSKIGAQLYIVYTAGGGTTLSVSGITQGNYIETFSLVQEHNLSISGIAQGNYLEALSLVQEHNLSLAGISQANHIEEPTLTVTSTGVVTADDILQSNYLEALALVQEHNLSLAGISQANHIEAPTLTVTSTDVVTADDILQANYLEALSLVQEHNLSLAGISQANHISGITLSVSAPGVETLTVAGITQPNYIEGPALVQEHNLALGDVNQPNYVAGLELIQEHNLSLSGISQANYIEAVAITLAYIITPAAITTQPTIDVLTLVQEYYLSLYGIAQANYIESPTLSYSGTVYLGEVIDPYLTSTTTDRSLTSTTTNREIRQ